MYISTFSILYYHSHGWLHFEKNFLNFLQMAAWNVCEQYHNMLSFPVWLQIQYGRMLLFIRETLDILWTIIFQIV